MAVKPIPEGYGTVTPYLTVDGAEKLIDFVKEAFDGEERGGRLPLPDGGIGHAEVVIGDSVVMVSDPSWQSQAQPGKLTLYVEDCHATHKRAVEAGAKSLMEPADQFWGDRMSSVQDPVGNTWYITTHIEDLSPEDVEKRAAEWAAAQQESG